MKKNNRSKWVNVYICFAVILTLFVPTFVNAEKTITLKAVSFLPVMSHKTKLLKRYVKAVNEKAKGKLKIKLLGGPEVVGQMAQGQAVSRGAIDMAMIPPAFVQGMIPEAVIPLLSRISQEEELKREMIEKLQPYYNKANIQCLGEIFGVNDPQFFIFTNKKVDNIKMLEGLSIGGTGPLMIPLANALKFDLKIIPLSDVYTALERKLVDGWLSTAAGIVPFGAHEQLKYQIDHAFFSDYVVVVMNLGKYKEISEDQRKLLRDTLLEISPELGRLNANEEYKALMTMKNSGIKIIKFPRAEIDQYLDSIYEAMWNSWAQKRPQSIQEFRKMLTP